MTKSRIIAFKTNRRETDILTISRSALVDAIVSELQDASSLSESERRLLAVDVIARAQSVSYVKNLANFFWPRVVRKKEGCWEWNGSVNKWGYGVVYTAGGDSRRISANRASWVIHNGPIPEGLVVCHKCDNPSCTNPDHLFLGTHKDNAQDCIQKGRQNLQNLHLYYKAKRERLVCPRGHRDYRPRSDGTGRYCKTCQLMHGRRYREKKQENSHA